MKTDHLIAEDDENVCEDQKRISKLGTISVRTYKASSCRQGIIDQPGLMETPSAKKISEKSLKGSAKSHFTGWVHPDLSALERDH